MVHASRVRVGLSLRTEHRGIRDDIGDVIQHVGLDLNEVWLAKNDDLDGVCGITG